MQLKTVFVISVIAAAVLAGCGDKKASVERAPIEVATMTATPTTASGTLPSPFPMVRVGLRFATAILRVASPQRKSPTSDSREK